MTLLKLGRYLFAIGIAAFGAQYFLYGHYSRGLPPVPPWAPGGTAGAYFAGALLIATALGIAISVKARLSALVLGSFLVLCVLALHAQRFADIIAHGTARTGALEPLALGGAALALAGRRAAKIGRFLFAFSMVIFGTQHFQYLKFVASLIPQWIPGHEFWVVLTGVGFIAAGLAIGSGILGRLGATWLGIMFLLWFVLLHVPLVIASPHNGDLWSSALVALAMSGGAFLIAGTMPRGKRDAISS